MPIALIVHGGAWAIPSDQVQPHRDGCQAALEAGWSVLETGGSAIDACAAAVRVMEDHPALNAGTGAVLNAEGQVELDAAIMDGQTLAYGAVASLRHIRNPIMLACHVLRGPATMLVSEGAERFACSQGIALCANDDLVIERERRLWQEWRDSRHIQHERAAGASMPHGHETVGAIALDQMGKIVAASSTGGTAFKLPGRVGATPLIGSGIYADARSGACLCTGVGETITRLALARRAVGLLERSLSPQVAAEYAVKLLARRAAGGSGGCIIMNIHGQVGLAWSTPRMVYAFRSGA